MKTLTKASIVLVLAGSLTSVLAATNAQISSSTKVQNSNNNQLSSKQAISVKTQIAGIEHASTKNRVKLVNAFKAKIQTMSPREKQQAMNMNMYSHTINSMQGGMNHAQTGMHNKGFMGH